jgi:signal transduction histidine kinase
MIGNIVNNAILYTQTGGKVRVSARQREDRVILTIADNGPGIAAAERSRVFDRFYRILNEDTARITGSGLGLSIVKAIADRHGAHISIKDGLDRKGASFEIILIIFRETDQV